MQWSMESDMVSTPDRKKVNHHHVSCPWWVRRSFSSYVLLRNVPDLQSWEKVYLHGHFPHQINVHMWRGWVGNGTEQSMHAIAGGLGTTMLH